jgi:DNA-3-methyladenine glycosylase I
MQAYHDQEWGVPVHDDYKHFEFLVLDAAQAGLRWKTVLHKRAGYREAFAGFDFEKVATFGQAEIDALLHNPAIIRNRQKIQSAITNARAMLAVREKYGCFDRFIWQFTGGKTLHNAWGKDSDIPALSPESEAMSKALKSHGFSFVGSTICYAYMQAAGMVNDHLVGCKRHQQLRAGLLP